MDRDGAEDQNPGGFAGYVQELIDGQIEVSLAFACINNAVNNEFGAAKPDVIG